jgi:methionyl aminopeptidase
MTINRGEIINLKDEQWLSRQKHAGQAVAHIHKTISQIIRNEKNVSLKNLEQAAERLLKTFDCEPTFFNYRGFPGKICTSVNNVIVHGFPTDYILQDGDVVKVDVGATFEGAIGDCACTYVYGKTKNPKIAEMLSACFNALHKAIKAIEVGKNLGIIGSTIFKESKRTGFGVLTDYGGHGIDYNTLHASPFVPNKSRETDGIIIQPGLSIAIEPMFVLGNNINTKTHTDKWSVLTKDIGCHFEHSVTIDSKNQLHIITEHLLEMKDFLEVEA